MSVSALLKSAAATRKKIRAQEDAIKAFEWESSYQTRADFEAYNDYLEDRIEGTTDPSDQLSYLSKQRTIRRSFTSNEIQRAQMSILEGSGTTTDKLEAIYGLYGEAVANQDFTLAQNLANQAYTLQVQIQNEAESNARAFRSSSSKTKEKFIDSLIDGFDDVTLPSGEKVSPLAAISEAFAESGNTLDTARAAQDTLEAIAASVIDQYESATTQEEIDKLEEKYGRGLSKLGEKLFIKMGGEELAFQDVVNLIANDEFNNPLYGLRQVRNSATGEISYELSKNNVESTDYVRRINEQGQEEYVPLELTTDQSRNFFGTSDVQRSLSAQITDQGEVIGNGRDFGNINMGTDQRARDDSQSIENRLKALGYEVRESDGRIYVKLPGDNVERAATIQPDGSIRFFGDDGNLQEVGLIDRNLGTEALPNIAQAGVPRVVSPEELSDFGSQSAFGGQLSAPSLQGQRYISDILGRTPAPRTLANNTIRTGNDFSGFGTAVTSNLLQTAGYQQRQIQLQRQAEEAQRVLQQQQQTQVQGSRTFNLNQTPVQQLTSNGTLRRQLRVSLPQAQPRLTVSAPRPTPRVRVSAPAPTPRVSVGAPLRTPSLTVR